MNLSKLAKDFSIAATAQALSLVLSFALSFFVPKFLEVEEFGYWQLFVFYSSYSGFLTLGLNDGVYLLNGGTERGRIDKSSVSSQFLVSVALQATIAVFVALIAITCFEQQRQWVVFLFAVYTLLYNLSGYLGYLFQAMNETRLFSLSTILAKGTYFIPLFALLCIRADSFVPYAVFYTAAQAAALLYCLYNARDILCAEKLTARAALGEAKHSASVGIKLMLANISSMLILGSMRFLADMFWGVEVFGEISFSLSLVNLFIVFVSQLAMVLFPALRQLRKRQLDQLFSAMRIFLGIALPAAYLLSYPIRAFVSWWLPQYSASLAYFSLLLPICVFDSKMSLLGTTFFKVLRKEGYLLFLNACSVAASLSLSLFGILFVNNATFVLLSAVLVIMVRSFTAELFLAKDEHMGSPSIKLILSEVGTTAIYLLAASFLDMTTSLVVTCAAYTIHLVINRRSIYSLAKQVQLRLKGGKN